MNEALEKLKDIGAQKIYEDTHIPVEHVQSILYESFEGLNKLQFLGFVSIMEREYGEDLSIVREKGIIYFNEMESSNDLVKNEAIYKAPSNKKNLTIIYIVLAIIIFVVAIIYTMDTASNTLQNITAAQNNETIESVKEQIIKETNLTDVEEKNETQLSFIEEQNSSAEAKKVEKAKIVAPATVEMKEVPKATVAHTLKIVPKTRVWLGYIDVKTNKKYQKTFKGSLKLDPKKEWLLYFGHGYVTIVINGKKVKYSDKNPLRLHYKNGKVSKISINEFKRLNRGSKW